MFKLLAPVIGHDKNFGWSAATASWSNPWIARFENPICYKQV
jgi:hypothetical protein